MIAKKIWHMEDSGPLARIDHRNLPDLDDLMLELAAWSITEDPEYFGDDRFTYVDYNGVERAGGGDRPTRVASGYDRGGEAKVGWMRTNPCTCGGEHSFDLVEVTTEDGARPDGKAGRGTFMAVYTS